MKFQQVTNDAKEILVYKKDLGHLKESMFQVSKMRGDLTWQM
jgi:hypothetical protein